MLYICSQLATNIREIMQSKKPFVFGKAVGDDHFIGREKEMERLAANMRYGVNTILISPRRWGKTSLVKMVGKMVNDDKVRVIHIDAYACRSEYDFYNAFAIAILQQTASRMDEVKEMVQDFIGRIIPTFSVSFDPQQTMSMSLGISPKTHRPEEILNLPELIASKRGQQFVICIDEFQQIGDFPDSITVQKRLRSVWQHQEHVSYCLCGSKKHMMTTLFQQRSKPFYKFGSTMYLPVIPTEVWVPYLCKQFASEGKTLSQELAAEMCTIVENNSSYVQELAFNVLLCTRGIEVTQELLKEGIDEMIDSNVTLFIEKTEHLTTYQMNYLRALISGVHNDFGKADIRERYNLGSPTNVKRIKDALEEREIVDVTERGVFISDPVLSMWLRKVI